MDLSLPVDVRAALTDAGLSLDEARIKTGDELAEAIGAEATYGLAVALAKDGTALARRAGFRNEWPLRSRHLLDRNLEVLRLRLIEEMNHAAIGRTVGLGRTRVGELLRSRFGVDVKPHDPSPRFYVDAADVPVLRDALLHRLQGAAEHLASTLAGADTGGWYAAWDSAHDVVRLLLDLQKDEDTDLAATRGSTRRAVITQALREFVEDRSDLADACERMLASMP